jgi:excisionase family DNA binding protein
MTGSIHTLPEVAVMLKVAEKTIYTMAQKGQIPAFKVRGQWRFKQDDIDRWIDEQKAVAKENAVKDTPNV